MKVVRRVRLTPAGEIFIRERLRLLNSLKIFSGELSDS